jgi:hypothetical protein
MLTVLECQRSTLVAKGEAARDPLGLGFDIKRSIGNRQVNQKNCEPYQKWCLKLHDLWFTPNYIVPWLIQE